MTEKQIITRRALLKASPAILAIAIAPALPVLLTPPAQAHSTAGDIDQAIAKHRQAMINIEEALDESDRIETALFANPDYDRCPRILVANLITGHDSKTPIYAYTVDEVMEHGARHAQPLRGWHDRQADAIEAKYRGKRDELAQMRRAKELMEQQAGLPEATQAIRSAYAAERRASAELILIRPANAREASAKQRYMAQTDAFTTDWMDEDLITVIIELAAKVA